MKSFFNYYGNKKRIAGDIAGYIRPHLTGENTYYEPFVGSGSVYLELGYPTSVIGDIVPDVINTFECVRDGYQKVIDYYNRFTNTEESYYQLRNLDRHPMYESRDRFFKAARYIFLTRTAFGGVTYNLNGQINQSYNHKPNLKVKMQEDNLRQVSGLLQTTEIRLDSYVETLSNVKKEDVVYLDPPYAGTKYNKYWKTTFTEEDMYKLKTQCDGLDENGGKFFLSYIDNGFIRELYQDYRFISFSKYRPLDSKDNKQRRYVDEILVTNTKNILL